MLKFSMDSPSVRIGISSSLRRGEKPNDCLNSYVRALEHAGAQAICLPVGILGIAGLYNGALDGLVLSGGGDIEPELYGGDADRCDAERDPERDRTEIALLIGAFVLRLPLLCICRGLQLANAALGGTLIEDLPAEKGQGYLNHGIQELKGSRREYTHAVAVKPGTRLFRIIGRPRFEVNSRHHQAIRKLAPGLVAAAHSDDGVIEAIESLQSRQFFIGVQWHPEASSNANSASSKLFSAFVEAATRSRGNSGLRDSRRVRGSL